MSHDHFLPTRRDALILAGGSITVAGLAERVEAAPFAPVQIPDWVHGITRMTFCSPGEVAKAARAGAQVIHTNVIWPNFPLKRDGGGLAKEDDAKLRALLADCRQFGVKLVLGLPPFPPVTLVKQHPE
jgi:hypothetical protein